MKRLSFLVFLSVLLAGCSIFENRIVGDLPLPTSKQETDWKNMSGKWYSKTITKDKEIREELCDRFQDGAFILKFKTTDKSGNVTIELESGEWGISGNIYFTVIKAITTDGVPEEIDVLSPYYRDAYKIKSLTENIMVYKHSIQNDTYKDTRVNKNFELK